MRREKLTDELVQWIQDNGSNGTIPERRMDDHVIIGRFTAEVLTIIKCPDLELVTSVSVIEKMMFDHAISATKLKALHTIICQPERVYRSASHPDTSIVLMTMQRLGTRPIVIPIWLSKPGPTGKSPVHWIASGYAKDDPASFDKWDASGLLLWKA